MQIYLLCYGFTRYQMLNDTSLDALKKRKQEYKTKAMQYAKEQAVKHIRYLLNRLHNQAKTAQEKDFLTSLSPGAWTHINLLRYYLFCGPFTDKSVDDWLSQWNWRSNITL